MVEHNENNMLNLLSIIHVYYYKYVLLGLKIKKQLNDKTKENVNNLLQTYGLSKFKEN